MENIKIILSLASTSLGLFITLLTFLIKLINNKKAKKLAEQALQLSTALLPYIQDAEKFTNYSGAEKKAYVITKANQFALDHNIIFDANQVSQKIEELVTLTKQVNNTSSSTSSNIPQPTQTPTATNQWL